MLRGHRREGVPTSQKPSCWNPFWWKDAHKHWGGPWVRTNRDTSEMRGNLEDCLLIGDLNCPFSVQLTLSLPICSCTCTKYLINTPSSSLLCLILSSKITRTKVLLQAHCPCGPVVKIVVSLPWLGFDSWLGNWGPHLKLLYAGIRLSCTWVTYETGSRRTIKRGDNRSEIPAAYSGTAHII